LVNSGRATMARPARVIAFDARTGKVDWKQALMDADVGYAMTLAPLVVNGKVMVGISGGEYGGRGFVTALDAATGKEACVPIPCRCRASRAARPGPKAPTRPAVARPG
jgi:outer membrane protein assembly factor BamB